MALEGCAENCGWTFAILSALAWGSFGVPIKGKQCSTVDVDPLVMQSYKTVMNALTSIVLLWYLGDGTYTEDYWVFSPWGIVSGLFWVPGATCGIYAIRTVGLAVSQGLWSSIIVMTSFVVGIFFFGENVKSVSGAVSSALLVVAGIGGMARYSSPERQPPLPSEASEAFSSLDEKKELVLNVDDEDATDNNKDSTTTELPFGREAPSRRITKVSGVNELNDRTVSITPLEIEGPMQVQAQSRKQLDGDSNIKDATPITDKHTILIFGHTLTKRHCGLGGAVINGLWGGSNLIPMHFARRDGNPGGLAYLVSFALGSNIVLGLCWLVRLVVYSSRLGSLSSGYNKLPSLHLSKLWLAGGISGLCYSVGNISSILAVMYLGQGVGYSLSQSSMLVSGLWGIFYYREIRGREMITKWLMAATITLVGILWLTYEHESTTSIH